MNKTSTPTEEKKVMMPEAGSHEKRGSMLQTVDNNDIKNSLAAMIQKNKITKQKTIKEDVVEEEK